MVDPDAPNPSNPTLREYLHWWGQSQTIIVGFVLLTHDILVIFMQMSIPHNFSVCIVIRVWFSFRLWAKTLNLKNFNLGLYDILIIE